MTRRRKKKPRERGRRLLGRLRSEERKNIARWKKNGRRCDKRSETRLIVITMFIVFSIETHFSPRIALQKRE